MTVEIGVVSARSLIRSLSHTESRDLTALLEQACADSEALGYGLESFEFEGEPWIKMSGYYAQRVVQRTLRESGLPDSSSSHCVFDSINPVYLNTTLFKDKISLLLLKASEEEEVETDVLVEHIIGNNRAAITWPQDPEQHMEFVEYFILLKRLIGSIAYDRENKSGVKIETVYLTEQQGSPVIVVMGGVLLPFGKNTMLAHMSTVLHGFSTKALKDVRFGLMTEDQKQAILTRSRFIRDTLGAADIRHVKYRGEGYLPGPQASLREVGVNARVMVDPVGCYEINPDFLFAILPCFDLNGKTHGRDITVYEGYEDSGLLNLAPLIISYDMLNSRWFAGNPSNCTEISFRKDAFDKLVLEDTTKEMIKALVLHRDSDLDTIENKNSGAHFLLDGFPGTGKTLTAEAVAEFLCAPLYKASMGDLGSDLEKLDARLRQILLLADRWKAILLIDEADSFMEARTKADLKRNAMVAVYLRNLEYYAGTLFLTTNRGADIDPAFESRLSMAIYFPKPDSDKQTEIWSLLLEKAGFNLLPAEVHSLLRYDANGRVIKNTCASALAIARYRQQAPGVEHLREILDGWAKFKNTNR